MPEVLHLFDGLAELGFGLDHKLILRMPLDRPGSDRTCWKSFRYRSYCSEFSRATSRSIPCRRLTRCAERTLYSAGGKGPSEVTGRCNNQNQIDVIWIRLRRHKAPVEEHRNHHTRGLHLAEKLHDRLH